MTRRPVKRIVLVPLAMCLAGALAWSAPAGAETTRAGFADTLDEILTDPRLDGAQSSVVVADAESGEVLYEHNGDSRLMPASNSKLLSSAAALDVLGPDYTWDTEVYADGRVNPGGVLHGDLYVRGTGDPTLLYEDYQSLASQLADAGVRKVQGDLVADDTTFDDERFHWGWNVDDEQYYYGAPISALTVAPDTDYDAGTVLVTITPGKKAGDQPDVSVYPDSGFVTIENNATTSEAGSPLNLPVNRVHGQDVITVDGSIAVDADATSVWRAVMDPTGHAAAVFATALAEEGISVRGTRLGEETPDDAKQLASHESMTAAELMNPFMKLSNNGHAEVLIKTMGYEATGAGTWSAGTAAARESLAGFGMDESVYVLADGSGLTRRNWVPAEQFATMLHGVRDEAWFDTWYQELPIACEPDRFTGGTLNTRMCDTPAEKNVHAKTGTLTGATGLSGYVTDADGRELIFSVVFNYYMASSAPKDLEDALAVALASYSADGESGDSAERGEGAAGQDSGGADAPTVEELLSQVPDSGISGEHESAWSKPVDLTVPGGYQP